MTLNFSSEFINHMPLPKSGEVPDALKCALCLKLLHNAILITECGCKYCETPCYRQVLDRGTCSGDTEDCQEIDSSSGIADKGTRRNVLNLKVMCIFNCGFEDKFKEHEAHLSTCPKYPEQCRFCQQDFCRDEIQNHTEMCDLRRIQCEFCDTELLHSDMFEHHNILSDKCCNNYVGKCPYCGEAGIHRNDISSHKGLCPEWPVECPFKPYGCSYQGSDLKLHLKESVPEHQVMLLKLTIHKHEEIIEENERLRDENQQLREMCRGMETKAIEIEKEFEDRWKKFRKVQSILANCREKQIDTDKIVERFGGSMESFLTQAQSMMSSQQASGITGEPHVSHSYDGMYMWKIDNYSARRSEARNGSGMPSITSVPFYSEPYGYKMCCRVYLNGDGSGRGTHMSVFIVVMKSKYDSILKWPFTNRVTFTLINQERGDNHVETFSPDQKSHSFKRPVDEMNIASGCPRFISFVAIDGNNFQSAFLKDDTIFLRIQVAK